jgi:hypothetical protein
MRETCARVLAGALLIAAVAGVVGLSALSGPADQTGAPLAAPPSALQRTVRLTAFRTAVGRGARVRPAVAAKAGARTEPKVVRRGVVFVRRVRHVARPAPHRRLAGGRPHPAVVAQVGPPVTSEPAAQAPPVVPAVEGDADGHGGHGYGRGRGSQDD